MDLVIMAAGMGSRFGGLKQIEPVGPSGEFIIDYNIYDAIKCGFKNIILIIKEEHEDIFRESIGKRIEKYVNVKYVYQKNAIPNREKPLGTAHAILCAKSAVSGNFAVINSDDFYGRDCFKVLSKFLCNMDEHIFGTVGYKVDNTLAKNGSVKRGVLNIKDDIVIDITESVIEKRNGEIFARSLGLDDEAKISIDTLVSMNALAFSPVLFEYLEEDFQEFLKTRNLEKDEYLIPDVMKSKINANEVKVVPLKTCAKWYGMTYKEDKEDVINAISDFIKKGEYPVNLWDEKNFI